MEMKTDIKDRQINRCVCRNVKFETIAECIKMNIIPPLYGDKCKMCLSYVKDILNGNIHNISQEK